MSRLGSVGKLITFGGMNPEVARTFSCANLLRTGECGLEEGFGGGVLLLCV